MGAGIIGLPGHGGRHAAQGPPPPPATVLTWSGCYLGGSVGGIWRQTDNVTIGVHYMWDWLEDVLKPGT